MEPAVRGALSPAEECGRRSAGLEPKSRIGLEATTRGKATRFSTVSRVRLEPHAGLNPRDRAVRIKQSASYGSSRPRSRVRDMNVLKREKQIAVISMLVEGSSIRSVERVTGVHRDTIMRLMVRVGEHCSELLDKRMRGLRLQSLQADEIWTFIAKKQRNVQQGDPSEYGDSYTFLAIDPLSKIVPWFEVGKRDEETTYAFVGQLAQRVDGRVQISTDGWGPYRTAVPTCFGSRADFEQIIKVYSESPDEHRYSPPRVTHVENRWVQGTPRSDLVCTSHVERHNLSVRTSLRRFTRLALGFSRKLANLKAAVAIYLTWYNFGRIHRTLRMTPAMAAGLAGSVWTVADLLP